MIVGSIFFTVLPLLLENVQGNAGHNSDSKIIAFIAFIEFLAIIALLLEHIFPSENKKNNGRVIDKLRSDKNNLITEIDKLKKEKEIVEDKNRAQNKEIEEKVKTIQSLSEEIRKLKRNNNYGGSTGASSSNTPPAKNTRNDNSDYNGEQEGGASINKGGQETTVKQEDDKEPSDKGDIISKVLYASAYSKEKKTFSEVSPNPTDNTIYVMLFKSKNETEAELSIYPQATEKIIDCRDFLEICCETIGYGNELKVEKPGLVIQEDGLWKIKDKNKVIVKFIEP